MEQQEIKTLYDLTVAVRGVLVDEHGNSRKLRVRTVVDRGNGQINIEVTTPTRSALTDRPIRLEFAAAVASNTAWWLLQENNIRSKRGEPLKTCRATARYAT